MITQPSMKTATVLLQEATQNMHFLIMPERLCDHLNSLSSSSENSMFSKARFLLVSVVYLSVKKQLDLMLSFKLLYKPLADAGWSSLVARRAHNPKVVGSNPAPATTFTETQGPRRSEKNTSESPSLPEPKAFFSIFQQSYQ